VSGPEIVVVVGIGAAAAAWLALPTRRSLAREGHRFAGRNGMWLAPDLVAAVDRAHLRERRVLAAALVVAVAVLVVVPGATVRPFVVAGSAVAVSAVGRLLVAGRDFPVRPGQVLVARARAVRVSDYLAPSVLAAFGLWLLLGAATAGLGVAWSEPDLTAAGLLLMALTLVVAAHAVAVCRRPEPAGDPEHLFLQDAWRAARLRTTLTQLGWAALLLATGATLTDRAGGWFVLPVAVGLLAAGLAQRDPDRFRARLWPDVPAGRVLTVGGRA